MVCRIISKYFTQVHTATFGWQKYETKREPSVKDGWITIPFDNGGTQHIKLDVVDQYTIDFEHEDK